MAIPSKEKYTNRVLASDIEARGFLDIVNNPSDVWCIVSRDLETDEFFLFSDYPEFDNMVVEDNGVEYTIPPRTGSLEEGVTFWELASNNGSTLSVHNMATYDRPLINKIWPDNKINKSSWFDTFIWSKIAYFDRPQKKGAKSPHGLLNYSLMQGLPKPKVEDFSKINAYMMHRACVDTVTQKYCHQYLEAEHKKLNNIGIDLWEAYHQEEEYVHICHLQEVYGVKIDVDHAKSCVEWLDNTVMEYAKEIEPNLPPTVKPAGAKIPRSELMRVLGYHESKIPPDELETVTRAGETKIQPIKPYVKPSVNFHKTEKVNNYSGFNISYGESPTYIKKADLTKWIKTNHPDTKPKDWDIQKEVLETKVLNSNCCQYFGVSPEDTDLICGPHTRVSFNKSTMTQHEVVKGLLIREGISWASEWNIKKDSDGNVVKAEEDMVVSYPPKASKENQIHVKIKKRDPIYTSPKFGEKEYEQLSSELGKKVGLYNTYVHRRRYLENLKDPENKGLLSFVDDKGRVPAGVNAFNTATGRASHRVIVNLPADGAVYGKEMRQCIIASEGKEFVGIDQKSSQLSICAFITNNTDYYNAVATGVEFYNDDDGEAIYHGSSAHCVNSRYFNLVTKEEWEEAVRTQNAELIHSIVLRRKKSKSLSFATLFGCGAKKLAVMGGFTEDDAQVKLDSFLDSMGLAEVIEFLKVCKKKYKRGKGFYIPTGFGYWVYCGGMHKAVNYLIQSLEGVVQKRAVIDMYNKFTNKRWWGTKVNKVLDMHDEVLMECEKGLGVEVGKLVCESYTQAGVDLNHWYKNNLDKYPVGSPDIICDFAGGYAVGKDYMECH